MCEVYPSNHHDIYFRDKVAPSRSAVISDIEDREFAFGLLDVIKLETPEARKTTHSLWNYGIYDPFYLRRETFRSQDRYPRCPSHQDHMDFNI